MKLQTRISVFYICSILLIFCRYVRCSFQIPGSTSPASVEIEVGGSVNISCSMNPNVFENYSAKDLYFIDAITHEKVPDTEIVIINDKKIIFTLRNAKESKLTYRCMCGNSAIMETKVYVGHKPEPISNFVCSSYNYENMRCNFTKPDNHILTTYNVSYHFDLKAYKYSPKCDHEKSPFVTCTALHANENVFHYEIIATNSLGTLTQHFDVDNMSVMVLAAPGQNFSLKNITATTATFTFRLKNPSRNLQWEVILKPKNLSAIILSPYVNPVSISSNEFELSLTNLTYAYYEYEISLRVRLAEINNWSEPFRYWFRTLSRLPDRPPRIDVGAFEIHPSERQVHLYWELLEPYEYNGYNFTYVVEQIEARQFIKPLSLESNSAVFLWNKEYSCEFAIRSKNHLGMSQSFSRITIPAMVSENKRKMHTPPEVHNMYHERNETFTLNWSAPKVEEGLLDYTVFWCRKRSLLLNGCEGSIHFQRVPRNVLNFTTSPQEHLLNLAVSANYKDFNTGMHWTDCTVAETTDLVKMEPKVEATSASTIKIEWGSENICPSIFDGYNLSYCPVDVINRDKNDSDVYNCINNESERFILINKTSKRYELQKLKPFTHYKIEMFMYSQRKFGKKSNSQIVQTFETAPTQPLDLKVLNKSNTSATISWLPPKESNGIIRFYKIIVNNESIKIPAIANDTFGRVSYKLENLSSSTSYNVHVFAQTAPNAVSLPSKDINFTTFVGYPLTPGPVSLHDNKNDAEIEWVVPAGRVDFYEVCVTLMKGDEVLGRRISVVIGSNSCTFRIPKCFDHEYRTTVEVRSVNAALKTLEVDTSADNDNLLDEQETEFYEQNDELSCTIKSKTDERQSENFLQWQKTMIKRYSDSSVYRHYKSNWHRGTIFSCAASTWHRSILYIFLATFFAGCLIMIVCLMRQKYNKMANINCTLPAGLDAYMTKDFSGVSSVLSHNFMTVIKGDIMNNQSTVDDKNESVNQNIVSDSIVQNEEHCLLGATSFSSLCMNDQVPQLNFQQNQDSSQNISSALIDNSTENRVRNFDMHSESELDEIYSNGTTITENLTIDSPYVQATDILNQCQNGMISMIPINNSYIKPNASHNWQNINQDYISADSIDKVLPKTMQNDTECGYTTRNTLKDNPIIEPITGAALQEGVPALNLIENSNAGYTTLEQLNKLSTFIPGNGRNDSLPSEARPAISGYVTHRELTAYGHQRQNVFSEF